MTNRKKKKLKKAYCIYQSDPEKKETQRLTYDTFEVYMLGIEKINSMMTTFWVTARLMSDWKIYFNRYPIREVTHQTTNTEYFKMFVYVWPDAYYLIIDYMKEFFSDKLEPSHYMLITNHLKFEKGARIISDLSENRHASYSNVYNEGRIRCDKKNTKELMDRIKNRTCAVESDITYHQDGFIIFKGTNGKWRLKESFRGMS
jgi:hypothetical protein